MDRFAELYQLALTSEVDYSQADDSQKYRGFLVGEGYFASREDIDEYLILVAHKSADHVRGLIAS